MKVLLSLISLPYLNIVVINALLLDPHPRPDERELVRLSPSQFPLGTIYPAATVGWMALRPIASSGKLNITHVYPTNQQHKSLNLQKEIYLSSLTLLLQGLTCSWNGLDWIFHPSHYSRLNYPPPLPRV